MISASHIQEFQRFWDAPDEGADLMKQIEEMEDVTLRTNWKGHITASALVLTADADRVLMIDAIKFGKFLLPGGHLDPPEEPWDAALRELVEETGLSSVRLLRFHQQTLPIEINSHWIEANERRSEPRHRHHDFIYPFVVVGAQYEVFDRSAEARSVDWRPVSGLHVSYPKLDQRLQIVKEKAL